MKSRLKLSRMPGLLVPAFFFSLVGASPAIAQGTVGEASVPSSVPPSSIRPTPSQLELTKMIWSTIAAVEHANQSGNYSVLRDISAQGFQINNNAAQLAQVFAGLRASRIDLANALLVPPTFLRAPEMVRDDIFRVQGVFQMRPIAIGFDLHFQWEQGRWKLFGIDLQPLEMSSGRASN